MGDIAYLFAYVKLFDGLRCQVFLAYSVPNCSSKVFFQYFSCYASSGYQYANNDENWHWIKIVDSSFLVALIFTDQ